jgi:hypothetical protein
VLAAGNLFQVGDWGSTFLQMMASLSLSKTVHQLVTRRGRFLFVISTLILLSACSAGDSGAPAPNDDITRPDPAADYIYITKEETPIVISFEPASTTAQFTFVTDPSYGQLTLQPNNREFVYLPQVDFFGYDRLVYTDGDDEFVLNIFVDNVNDPPYLRDDLRRVIEQGTLFSEALNAGDPDRDELVYSAANLPSWLSLNSTTGVLTGAPGQEDVGLVEGISLKVVDPFGEFAEVLGISLEVLDVNDAPTINPDQFPSEMDARSSLIVNVFPDDPDGEFVTINVESNDFLDTDVLGGSIAVTAADVIEVTEVNLVVLATDSRGNVAREILPVTLYPMTPSGKGRTLLGRQSGAGVHLVVMGDGYRVDQQMLFQEHVDIFINAMARDEGISVHFDAWNIHTVEAISADSGIDDNFQQDSLDTAFDSGYFCNSIQRLVCADALKVIEAAFSEYPDYHQIVVLINDERYGGSGGEFAVASADYPEIALHELGHSFAGLADEYVDDLVPKLNPNQYTEGRFPNISASDDPNDVPWRHWLTLGTQSEVGIFEGAFYQATDFFRPTFDSRMRSYGKPFGPVNSEAWALNVYQKAQAVIGFSPVTTNITIPSGQFQEFTVAPILSSSVQKVTWELDGEPIAAAEDRLSWTPVLAIGEHLLSVKVDDISGQIAKPPPHAGQFVWTWAIEKQ